MSGFYAPPTRVTLISHPATPAQKAGMFPLDEALDAQALAELAHVTWTPPARSHIVTAPELRTQQTAAALGLAATVLPELRDCDYGSWQGLSLEMLPPDAFSAWLSDIAAGSHGGESFHVLINRVGQWLDSQRDSGSIVAVTHASVIRATVVHALQLAPHPAFFRVEVAPLTLTDLRLTGNSWRVHSMGVPLSSSHPRPSDR